MNEKAGPRVVTVDGPSGVGKGTLAQYLASLLKWRLLDSGLIYRYFAWLAVEASVGVEDNTALNELVSTANGSFHIEEDGVHLIHKGSDITSSLRSEELAAAASEYSRNPLVRQLLKTIQREQDDGTGLVADGRDMGTIIFSDAPLKIYLTASAEVRANRRYKQLQEKGSSATLAALLEAIVARDEADSKRKVAPLKPAADAVIIDTSDLTVEDVQRCVVQLVESRFGLTL